MATKVRIHIALCILQIGYKCFHIPFLDEARQFVVELDLIGESLFHPVGHVRARAKSKYSHRFLVAEGVQCSIAYRHKPVVFGVLDWIVATIMDPDAPDTIALQMSLNETPAQ